MRLLLLSNCRSLGGDLPGPRCAALRDVDRALFVPFAGVTLSWDDYTARVHDRLAPPSVEVKGLHTSPDAAAAVAAAGAIVAGGGNTWQLLREVQRRQLFGPIRARVRDGAAYVGWSAGANLAGPTIRTTSDMPIVDVEGPRRSDSSCSRSIRTTRRLRSRTTAERPRRSESPGSWR